MNKSDRLDWHFVDGSDDGLRSDEVGSSVRSDSLKLKKSFKTKTF